MCAVFLFLTIFLCTMEGNTDITVQWIEIKQENELKNVTYTPEKNVSVALCRGCSAPPTDIKEQQKWMEFEPNTSYVFSAFYDDVSKPVVRVVGVRRFRAIGQVTCQLWFTSKQVPGGMLASKAKVLKVPPERATVRLVVLMASAT